MDAVKRASFASKQLPGGPAPLASFEDLPSDELESPEDSGVFKVSNAKSKDEEECTEDNTSDCNTLVSTNTPDTLNTSNLSTPQIDSDFDSHCTLTPVESKCHSASEFRAGSLSSLSKDDEVQLTKHKKGSVASLGPYETPEMEYNQRKSSWTDIFRSHNQNPKAIPESSANNLEIKPKAVTKKKKSDSSRRDHSEGRGKDRGKIFGIFKPSKKGSKSIESVSEDKICNEAKGRLRSVEDVADDKVDAGATEGKENEKPNPIELAPVILQNDLDKSTTTTPADNKNSDSSKENDMRNNLNIAEKEYNIFSQEVSCEKAINKEGTTTCEEEDHELSDSELALDSKEETLSKKEDDFENENLLAQDSSEIEDDLSLEFPLPIFLIPQPVSMTSRHQRQITTVPLDRPRSTTPINVAPLEAFIRTTSPSGESKVEKIKLILPGEQFLGRMKSPKRSIAKKWADFCEEGLHSPHMQKKRDDFHLSQDLFSSKFWDSSGTQEKQWVTFDSMVERGDTPDLFRDLPVEEKVSTRSKEESSAQIIKCSCECHAQGCENTYINVNELCSSASTSTKVDVFSDKCQCQCHERYVHLWSPTNSRDLLSDICDTLKSSEFSSGFASSFATE